MNLRRISNILFEFDARYPRSIIAVVILLTVILGSKIFKLEMDPGIRTGLPREHPIVKSMEKLDDLFSGSDIILIGVESDSLFSKSTLTKLSLFNDSLASNSLLSKVTSIFNHKLIIPDDMGFNIESVLDASSVASLNASLKKAYDDRTILVHVLKYDQRFFKAP